MKPKKILSIILEPVVSRWAELIIFIMLFAVDVNLIKPLYIHVFEMPAQLATCLSAGMAILYALIARVCAKLLARKQFLNAAIGFCIFLFLMVFSFVGQDIAASIMAEDPLMLIANEQPNEQVQSVQSKRHYITVGLTISLFSLAVFIGYVIALSVENVKGAKREITMSSIARWLQQKTTILQGKHDRASAKLTAIAEEKVNTRIEQLQSNLSEYQRIDDQLKGEMNYQLQQLDILYNQTVSMVNAVYNKKSFIQKIISWKKSIAN